jgi:hypothetical protein
MGAGFNVQSDYSGANRRSFASPTPCRASRRPSQTPPAKARSAPHRPLRLPPSAMRPSRPVGQPPTDPAALPAPATCKLSSELIPNARQTALTFAPGRRAVSRTQFINRQVGVQPGHRASIGQNWLTLRRTHSSWSDERRPREGRGSADGGRQPLDTTFNVLYAGARSGAAERRREGRRRMFTIVTNR